MSKIKNKEQRAKRYMEETIRNKFGIKDKLQEKLLKIKQISNSDSLQHSPSKRFDQTMSVLNNSVERHTKLKYFSKSNLNSNISSIKRIEIVPSTINQINNRSISYGKEQNKSK
jgi:hypothetical protein